MSERATSERWDEWARRQKTDPESAASLLVKEGVSFETALILVMLGKIHNELADLADGPREDWQS